MNVLVNSTLPSSFHLHTIPLAKRVDSRRSIDYAKQYNCRSLWQQQAAEYCTSYTSKLFSMDTGNRTLLVDMTKSLDACYTHAGCHSSAVAELAAVFAVFLKLPSPSKELLYWSGLLHDIGKLAIPKHILNKTSKLQPKEYAILRRHPIMSTALLQKIKNLQVLENIVLYHHERYDGLGYPQGLACNAIPLFSRILSLCDAYDAMTSQRCYKPSLSNKEACRELVKMRGSQFDPQLTDAFLLFLASTVHSTMLPRGREMRPCPKKDHLITTWRCKYIGKLKTIFARNITLPKKLRPAGLPIEKTYKFLY